MDTKTCQKIYAVSLYLVIHNNIINKSRKYNDFLKYAYFNNMNLLVNNLRNRVDLVIFNFFINK